MFQGLGWWNACWLMDFPYFHNLYWSPTSRNGLSIDWFIHSSQKTYLVYFLLPFFHCLGWVVDHKSQTFVNVVSERPHILSMLNLCQYSDTRQFLLFHRMSSFSETREATYKMEEVIQFYTLLVENVWSGSKSVVTFSSIKRACSTSAQVV